MERGEELKGDAGAVLVWCCLNLWRRPIRGRAWGLQAGEDGRVGLLELVREPWRRFTWRTLTQCSGVWPRMVGDLLCADILPAPTRALLPFHMLPSLLHTLQSCGGVKGHPSAPSSHLHHCSQPESGPYGRRRRRRVRARPAMSAPRIRLSNGADPRLRVSSSAFSNHTSYVGLTQRNRYPRTRNTTAHSRNPNTTSVQVARSNACRQHAIRPINDE
ncbi:hypothetical protein L226DRAFT_11243 [Lentinus tigrinus ALCF2SS1-7]|uniref:uncharacterized protein n=1 Tax=Lentinus tigrinus ALCF2SS1-7 TaxID=1328758 RepID=UPI001166387E|nr:hypothetical protein L226DRAFT_11243 [Lentinus tigrinus ALCF2SS1-7]